jgi:hypothetical protein
VDIYNPDIRAAHQETAQAEAAELARSFGHSYMPNHWGKYDVLINCSPLGEERPGLQGEIPVNMSAMAKHALVIDMVYNGPNGTTPLIRNARTLGHEVSTGFSFLLSQAIEQFRLNMHYTVDAEQAALIKDQDYLPRTRHAVRSKGLNPFSFGRIENMDLLDQLAQTKKCYARHVDGKTEIFAASREIAMQIYDSYVQMTT